MASFSRTSRKAKPKTKRKKGKKKQSHKQLIERWHMQGGKFASPKPKLSQRDKDRRRNESLRAKALQTTGVTKDDNTASSQVQEEPSEFPKLKEVSTSRTERARARLAVLARELQARRVQSWEGDGCGAPGEPGEPAAVGECKLQQLDEVMVLESMFPDELLLATDLDLDELRARVEALEDAGYSDTPTLLSLARERPLELLLQLSVPGPDSLEAFLLLRVSFPPLYPMHAPPGLHLEDVMIVSDDAVVTAGQPPQGGEGEELATQATLAEGRLLQAMRQQANDAQPDPCMYDLTCWLAEQTFSFLQAAP